MPGRYPCLPQQPRGANPREPGAQCESWSRRGTLRSDSPGPGVQGARSPEPGGRGDGVGLGTRPGPCWAACDWRRPGQTQAGT
eukprot:12893476-Alexandrium_andersonii.AAC.1